MLQNRIISTLRFFDLQDTPLTLFELHKYLLNNIENIKSAINKEYEVIEDSRVIEETKVPINLILASLDGELKTQVETKNGYYCLPGRGKLIDLRINNYFYGFKRERRIRRYLWFLKHLPFIRGAFIGGSQALGQPKPGSDIDLFIITDGEFLGLGRALATAYFQILGLRRHGKNIANRFCLNHYLAGVRSLPGDRNLYTAMEYLRLRSQVGGIVRQDFLFLNPWINLFFPNAETKKSNQLEKQSFLQRILEKLFRNSFGRFLEEKIKTAQLGRIQKGEFIVADNLEMSFHPNNRKAQLFSAFFES